MSGLAGAKSQGIGSGPGTPDKDVSDYDWTNRDHEIRVWVRTWTLSQERHQALEDWHVRDVD